jgi:hypothetical protein
LFIVRWVKARNFGTMRIVCGLNAKTGITVWAKNFVFTLFPSVIMSRFRLDRPQQTELWSKTRSKRPFFGVGDA